MMKEMPLQPDAQARETLITLTSDIVAAHVSNNNVAIDEVPALIENVFQALAGLGEEHVEEEAPLEPAVSIRASVRPDHVTCLECGKKLTLLKRHLMTDHGLTPDEYRQRWNLAGDHPLVAPNYAMQRRDLAVKIGLGHTDRPTGGSKAAPAPAAPAPAKAKAKRGRKLGLRFNGGDSGKA